MNILDMVISIILLVGAVRGFMKGFILEIAMLIALIAGAWGAHKLAHIASPFLQNHFSITSAYLSIVSFTVVFILIVVLIIFLAKLLEGLLKITAMNWANRIAGGIFGIVKWVFILSLIFYVISPLDKKFHLLSEEQKAKSFFYQPVEKISGMVFNLSEINKQWKFSHLKLNL